MSGWWLLGLIVCGLVVGIFGYVLGYQAGYTEATLRADDILRGPEEYGPRW